MSRLLRHHGALFTGKKFNLRPIGSDNFAHARTSVGFGDENRNGKARQIKTASIDPHDVYDLIAFGAPAIGIACLTDPFDNDGSLGPQKGFEMDAKLFVDKCKESLEPIAFHTFGDVVAELERRSEGALP